MKIGVAGAGNMGSGIAQKYATQGHDVVLFDNSDAGLKRGQDLIEKTLHEGVERSVFSQEESNAILSRLQFSNQLATFKDADLIIEAVFEDKGIKQKLFADLDSICSPQTIFATNTSSFKVQDLAVATKRPDKVIGLHYFYHPAKNRLVEVIRAEETSDDTFNTVFALQEDIGKIPITSSDSPGFVINRFFVPWLNEAMRLVEEGVANIATVEWAAKKSFVIGMGPFELMNVTGVPITLHAATTLYKELGDFYKPSSIIAPVVENKSHWDLTGTVNEQLFSEIESRLWGVVCQIAREMVLKEKVCSIEECDLGARVGLRWKRGPFEHMSEKDPHLAPKRLIVSKSGETGIITLNRPDTMNAIDEKTIQELDAAVDALAHDDQVRLIVLNGKGKSFAAGADTQFFVDNMRAKQVKRIVDFAAFGQKVFQKIDDCPKPVVAIIHGMTLGGGLELALACDHIICIKGTSVGFPETGIGIYPGLGGTQRTPKRIGIALARWLIFTGELLSAQRALEIGLIDAICEKSEAMTRALQFAQKPSWQDMKVLFGRPLSELTTMSASALSPQMQKALKRMATKAPIALKIADDLISSSGSVSLNEGLLLETRNLERIFSTEDALTGISSVGKQRPVFSGN